MVRHGLGKTLCLMVVLFVGTSTTHAEMMFRSSERNILGGGTQLVQRLEGTSEFGTFSDDLLASGYVRDEGNRIVGSVSATASQSSSLTATQIRGLGRGSGFASGPDAEGIATSAMTVDFTLTDSMRLTLSGQLRLVPHGEGIDPNGSMALIRLTGPEGIVMEVVMDEDNLPDSLGNVDFSGSDRISGVFAAGDYTLEAMSTGRGSHGLTRCADFDFTLTALESVAVPEPSAAGMLLLGGLAVFGRRRRRG